MGNKPDFRIVQAPYDKATKKWHKEYGAVWSKVWENGDISYSVKFSEQPPVGEYLRMVSTAFKKRDPQPEQPQVVDNGPVLDDEIPF